MSESHGRTSKIRRYYWRELAFREMELFGEWADVQGVDPHRASSPEAIDARRRAGEQALEEIKRLHAEHPKYVFRDESQAEVIRKYAVELLDLRATYIEGEKKHGDPRVFDGEEAVTIEEYAIRYFGRNGFEAFLLESRPFHVLFGVYMWIVIQDPDDPLLERRGFGDRRAFEKREKGEMIWTLLPRDFGTSGYAKRRADAIEEHFSGELRIDEQLEWLFDYWLEPSEHLRQYLWAHGEDDVERTRRLLSILPARTICEILRYLIGDYWHRYCGWPDLLVFNDHEYFLAEVKGSGDKLSEDQKDWIRGNYEVLHLPFKLVKIHKAGMASR